MSAKIVTNEEFRKLQSKKGRYKILIGDAIKLLDKNPTGIVEIKSDDDAPILAQGVRYSLPKGYEAVQRKNRTFILKTEAA